MELFDVVKNINSKEGHIDFDDDFKLNSFMLNRVFSNTLDSNQYAYVANMFSIDDSQMLYDFYYYGLNKAKRFGKWYKQEKHNDENFIVAICKVFGYNRKIAYDMYDILLEKRDDIIRLADDGGRKSK